MWPVRNKTIIGLKYMFVWFEIPKKHVRNKTIIGLKYRNQQKNNFERC